MSPQLLIDGSRKDQTQVALIENQVLQDFEYESKAKKHLKGNIYLGKVTRIEASLQAALIEIGSEKNAFLAFGEIHPNYFQIPVADKEALIAAEAEAETHHNKNDGADDDDDDSSNNDNEVKAKENTNNELEKNELDKLSNDQNEDLSENKDISKEKNKKVSKSRKKNIKKPSFRKKLFRSYKIQEVIKAGQLILVQVVKEERGNKGAAVTAYISLAGKYSVLMPNSTKTKGISRKISISDDRSKLKKIIEDLKVPTEMGLIIRTAGLNKTKNEIKRDYSSLIKIWAQIIESTKKSIAPALIHEEGNLLRRVIRDLYSKDMKEIYVEGSDAYKETKKYMMQIMPSCSKFVKPYKDKVPLFSKYKVENEISKMFDTDVKLKSGGYLVINPTEALVAVDVNSGSAIKERNIEKTALKTNLEAAEEISNQIKIRDLSGLIVIDFIDMYEMRNNRNVEKKLKESIKNDRARIQIGRISQFGLLEMSRQRLRQSFIDWKTTLSVESASIKVIYALREYINNSVKKKVSIEVEINPTIKYFILNKMFDEMNYFEKEMGIEIKFVDSFLLGNEEFKLDKISNQKNLQKKKIIKKNPLKKKKKTKKIIKKSTDQLTAKKNVSGLNDIKKMPIINVTASNNKKNEEKKIEPLKEIKNKKSGWWKK